MLQHWKLWEPSEETPWNLQRVVHLHRRAAFAANWRELQRDLRDGPRAAIDRLLAGESRASGVPDDFDEISRVLGDAAVGSRSPNRLKAWWMYRLLFSPDPVGEKLTLLWHNHFATSNFKVDHLGAMRRQNDLLRRHARGKFGDLLNAMLRDPALLTWLDAPANIKGSPNENLARELMELFTLGIGNYSETDVQQAARALTGLSVKNDRHAFQSGHHDAGTKMILGQTGAWRVDDLSAMLLAHPATSRRLAWRICDLLMGEGVVRVEATEELAAGLRQHDLNVGWALETVLRSELFFSAGNLRSRAASPVEFMINALRSLEACDPPPSTLLLAEWSARMGQDLFYPPNVGGWTGGRDWMSSRYIIARANFAAALVEGKLSATPRPPNLWKLANGHSGANDLEACTCFIGQALSGQADVDQCRQLLAAAKPAGNQEQQLRLAVGMLLARPESQLL